MSGDLVPATRNWSASEIADAGEDASARSLKISGEVELVDKNERPHLTMSEPPASNLAVLSLDLVVSADGDSHPQLHWAQCRLQHRTYPGAYGAVKVMWQGIEITRLDLQSL